MNKNLKILFVPSGGIMSPASRYRVYQILPFLKDRGIDYTVYSIFSERMTGLMIRSSTFKGIEKIVYYIGILVERFIRACRIILLADKFDMVFLQRTTFPIGLEKLLKAKNKNIIFDIDDPIYLPDQEEKGFVSRIKRYAKKREVISILRVSRCAIVENNYIKDFVIKYCKSVYLITGPIDTVKNYQKCIKTGSQEIIIGWIGSPSTTPYLDILKGTLKELNKQYRIKLRLIGASSYSMDNVKVETVAWSEQTEVVELHKFDIGVMSMPDNEWTRGKVGCKMLQYMANGIPTVVSHTPTTAEIIKDGINGFLADSEDAWFKKLSLLIQKPELMERIGKIGRKTIEENFSLEVSMPRYIEIFNSCANFRDGC